MDQINARAPEDRGAGGKLRKPPPRKPPASPYARPAETTRRRWISKLVDPACRLISGGATRILPSFFSKTPSGAALTGPSSPIRTEDQGKWQTGEQGHKDDGRKSDLHLWTSKSTEITNTGDTSDKLKSSSDFVLHRHDEKGVQSEKNRLSDIEQLVKGNKFSRDEFNRLVEVLNSRAMDLPNVEQGNENASLTARKDHKGLVVAHGLPKISNEQRHGELNGAIWGSSTPLGLSKIRDEIGASPVEIARAYMDSRASEVGPSSKGMMQTVESTVLHGNEAAIKIYDPSTSLKSSTCWPGAVVQDAYVTPQSQRSTYGLRNFPRTPYSRTLLSKSKSKLTHMQGDYNRISSIPLRQSQNTLYLQDKSKVDALESQYGSVGPIRRSRHKVAAQSSSRRPAYSSLNDPLQRESSDVNEDFMSAVTKDLEPDGKGTHKPLGSEVGIPTVHMHSSLMARKILEHIDRNLPTPKEKSAELKRATKWRNPESSADIGAVLSNKDNGLLKIKDVSPYKDDGLGKKNILRNEDQGNFHVDILPREITDKSINARKEGIFTSDMNVCGSIPRLVNDTKTSLNSGGSQFFSMESTEEDALNTLPCGGHPCVVNQEKKPFYNSSASKPALPPISIKKPDSRWTLASDNSSGRTLASDNSSGFTFPVSASPSVLSEPPTPSMMPLFSTGDQYQSKERSTEPSYNFGLKRSSPALVFSFPSTSSTSVHDDTCDIKFSFGSNEKARLSFSSFGKNTVCC